MLFLPGVVLDIREGQLSESSGRGGGEEGVGAKIDLFSVEGGGGFRSKSVQNPPAFGRRRFHTNTDYNDCLTFWKVKG